MARNALWGVTLVVVVAWVACEIMPAAPPPSPPTADDWRRTVDGWELASSWQPPKAYRRPLLHPLAAAGLILSISLLATRTSQDEAELAWLALHVRESA